MKVKVFETASENLIYLALSLIVFIARLGFTNPLTFIACIISYCLTSAITEWFRQKGKNWSEASVFSTFIAWAFTSLIFRWTLGWYFVGMAFYLATSLLYVFIECQKRHKNFGKIVKNTWKINIDKYFG